MSRRTTRRSATRSSTRAVRRHRGPSPYQQYATLAIAAALLLVILFIQQTTMHWYVAWLTGWGMATFGLYGYDKHRAQSGGGRVPERVLHGMALAGGVVGAWAGRGIFRHKTRHSSFTNVLVVATLIHASLLWWQVLAR